MVLLVGLAGCDQKLREEVAVLREEVAAQQASLQALRVRVEQLQEALAREGEARRALELVRLPPPPAPPPGEPPAPAVTFTPTCAGGTCTIARAELEALLADPALLARAARIVPMVKDGQTSGFKVFGIRPGSPLAALGLQNGDTVQEIGGRPLTSVEAALAAYEALKQLDRWGIRGIRKDAPFELVIEVK